MPPVPSAGGQGGFLLSLVTESFAVRALLGSLAALALAALMVRCGLVRSSRARRLLILAPVLTAALAGLASLRDAETYLPQLWITTAAATGGAAGQFLDLLGDLRVMSHHRQMDLLVVAYVLVVGALLLRRVAGMVAVRSLLRRARPPVGHGSLVALTHDFAARMQVRVPRVVFLDACPGGALTVGCRRPVVAIDPALLQTLDAAEIEGLIAHELAHIRRRDAPLGLVVGVFRDLTFFLPPLHLAGGWLRREQEESADELASAHTGRPAALASGILKVWDCSRAMRGPQVTCAAVAGRRFALAGAVDGRAVDPPLRGAAKAISVRVERLIARTPAIPMWRRRAETVLAAAVLATATTASLAIPGWLAAQHNADMLAFAYLTAQPATAVESPALATFRQLAPPARAAVQDSTTAAAASAGLEPLSAKATERGQCPCVEDQAQLRQATPTASAPAPAHMLWRSGEQRSWELDPLQRQGSVRAARPLFTLSDSGPQVGFFLVGGTS